MYSHFALYQTEDFVLDETFQSWVLQPDSVHRVFWDKYLRNYPHQKNNVQVARILVLGLEQMHQVEPDQQMAEAMWQKIQAEIHSEPQEVSRGSLVAAH